MRWQEENQSRIDLILCVGDFQAMRGEIDMRAMACPAKYQQVGDYPAYHIGEKLFPAEVVFIGGIRHEIPASVIVWPLLGPPDATCRRPP